MKTPPFTRALLAGALFSTAAVLSAQTVFQQTNLVSDLPGLAAHTDAHLVNPWGIARSGTSPFWVSDDGAGVSTIYNSAGSPASLVVSIPGGATPTGAPTGQVFNTSAGAGAFNGDAFIFASETGTIAGWRGPLGMNAEVLFDNSGSGASYTGITLGTVGGNAYLYAANFGQQRIDVFPASGAPALSGNFLDPTLPDGYSPFNIQLVGGSLFAAYAQQGDDGDEVKGAGLGLVDQFALDGTLVRRFATGGVLDAPWGFTLAPSSFGTYAGNLLVGNFGDGTINAFDLGTGAYHGTLADPMGNPIVNDGLWGITTGNGGNGGSTSRVYFAAGIDDETHGLFGSIGSVPDSGSTLVLFGIAFLALVAANGGRRVLFAGHAARPIAGPEPLVGNRCTL